MTGSIEGRSEGNCRLQECSRKKPLGWDKNTNKINKLYFLSSIYLIIESIDVWRLDPNSRGIGCATFLPVDVCVSREVSLSADGLEGRVEASSFDDRVGRVDSRSVTVSTVDLEPEELDSVVRVAVEDSRLPVLVWLPLVANVDTGALSWRFSSVERSSLSVSVRMFVLAGS